MAPADLADLTEVTKVGAPDGGDLRAMQVLAASYPERSTHVVDLPYRLALSPAEGEGGAGQAETARWYAAGELVGWALWLPRAQATDMAVHPKHAAALEPRILAWSSERARALARGRSEPLFWWVSAREDNRKRIALLEAEGFSRRPFVTQRYERVLAEPPPQALPPGLPHGYEVRPLGGEAEVPAYVVAHRAAFGSTAMNEPWRQRTLTAPGYRPDLDLVVASPEGRVVAFAILWLGPDVGGRRDGQFEPVGTHPDFQRRGFGRALMLEGMRRLRAAGATHALVETEDVRTAANGLYGSVMQRTGVRKLHFRKEVS